MTEREPQKHEPIGDFWDVQAAKLIKAGVDPEWVEFEIQHARKFSEKEALTPQGDAWYKRLMLQEINAFVGE